jgi:hypothetical protein
MAAPIMIAIIVSWLMFMLLLSKCFGKDARLSYRCWIGRHTPMVKTLHGREPYACRTSDRTAPISIKCLFYRRTDGWTGKRGKMGAPTPTMPTYPTRNEWKLGASDRPPAAGDLREHISQSRLRAALARRPRCSEPCMGFEPMVSIEWLFALRRHSRVSNQPIRRISGSKTGCCWPDPNLFSAVVFAAVTCWPLSSALSDY